MEIRKVAVSDVLDAPYNPRVTLEPGDPDWERLAASVDRWGLVEPLVWNERTGHLVGGHQRMAVIRTTRARKVEVSVVDLDDADERALNVALNKITGRWDRKKLASVISEISEDGMDPGLTGFSAQEIEAIMVGVPDTDEDPPAPEPPDTPKSVAGEVYELGPHRLMCGDSTSPEDVAKLFGGAEPVLMVTDPPYGVEYDPSWRVDAGLGGEGSDKMGKVLNDDRADWREAWALFPGIVAYVWHASTFEPVVCDSLASVGLIPTQHIVWVKDRFTIGRSNYHWQHEPCWYAVREGLSEPWHGGAQSSVWRIPARDDHGHGHGTQKPMESMKRPIEHSSSPGQAVYDPFGGSGTTLIAAERTGRVCYMMELSEAYCDVIRARYAAEATIDRDGPPAGQAEP